jgi:tetratricopeptide (TPR) repeat protein
VSQSWIAPFDSFQIGDEEIKNTRMRVADFEMGDIDGLVGADFFLSHRIYIAHGQRRLYFTYNGGPVFRLDKLPSKASAAVIATAPEPVDADGLARRAAARTSRADYAGAVADWDRVVGMEPKVAGHYYDRAIALARSNDRDKAVADLDQAIALEPGHFKALLFRGELRAQAGAMDGARQDFDEALKAAPDHENVLIAIAIAYEGVDDYGAAIANYDAWIAAHPKHPLIPDALNGRCWDKMMANRDLVSAVDDCDRALKEGPRSANVLDSRAWARYRLGQFDKAIGDFDAALKLQPRMASSLYGRGLTELARGQVKPAKADIDAASAQDAEEAAKMRKAGLGP